MIIFVFMVVGVYLVIDTYTSTTKVEREVIIDNRSSAISSEERELRESLGF